MLNGARSVLNGGCSMSNGGCSMLNGGRSMSNGGRSMSNGARSMSNGERSMLNGARSVLNGVNHLKLAGGSTICFDRLCMTAAPSLRGARHERRGNLKPDCEIASLNPLAMTWSIDRLSRTTRTPKST
jgi:hypothetical protein